MRAAHTFSLIVLTTCSIALAQSNEPPALIPEDTPPPEISGTPEEPAADAANPPPQVAPVVAAIIPATETDTWYDDIAFHAFVSTAYMHNFALNNPSVVNAVRLFDGRNDSFKVDVAQLTLQNEPLKPGEAGFRVDLVYGLVIPVSVGNGVAALQQAEISYIAPVGRGLRIDVGTFMSHIGAEVIETHENINTMYSRSLLFTGQPPLLSGLRLGYAFSSAFAITVVAVNGWSPNFFDTNLAKTVGAQLVFIPHPAFTLTINYLGGAEKPANNTDWRHLIDAVALLKAGPLTLTLEGLWGRQLNTGAAAASWGGALGILRWDVTDAFALAARGEYFNTDTAAGILPLAVYGAQIAEVSFTPSLTFSDTAVLRLEVRYDRALDGPGIFTTHTGTSNQQTTLAGNFLFIF